MRLLTGFFVLGAAIAGMSSCRKDGAVPDSLVGDAISAARNYVETMLRAGESDLDDSSSSPYRAASRELAWENAYLDSAAGFMQVWVPVHYRVHQYIHHTLDGHRLFNTDNLQWLRVWKGSSLMYRSELVTYFPDSNYAYGSRLFSGIILVRNWNDKFVAEYKIGSGGDVQRLYVPGSGGRDGRSGAGEQFSSVATGIRQIKSGERQANSHQGLDMITICFYSSGYNYAVAYRSDAFYWEIGLGCTDYFVDGGGSNRALYSGGGPAGGGSGGGGSAPGPGNNSAWTPNFEVNSGNRIIGDIRDYNKCFDNIAGYGHQYSVTLCVAQPVPGSRDAWGFTSLQVGQSADLVSAGHTFLILTQSDAAGTITRNVGFYPKYSASPIQPVDQGQLSNDEEHGYNISVTYTMDNSQFFKVLEFVSHGNDAGFNYDLNSNNCSSFAIRALRSAGIVLPVSPGTWPNGEGFNPGDLGEDLRNMVLQPGMSRSTENKTHPNSGICY